MYIFVYYNFFGNESFSKIAGYIVVKQNKHSKIKKINNIDF